MARRAAERGAPARRRGRGGSRQILVPAACACVLALVSGARGDGGTFSVSYPPATGDGALQIGVEYTVWIPESASRLRGVIVHQHGCGEGACKGGATASFDLHWRALASRWSCALLGPAYRQAQEQNCRLWCDPRNGSGAVFLRALRDLGARAGRPELERVPWCLWGHSGGGFWASLMQVLHPERIVAIWLRSGTAYLAWERGEIPAPTIPEAAYGIPVMGNPGVKEKGHPRFDGAWSGLTEMYRAYRMRGAPIGIAPDPHTGHECGDSRYLAIAYFDACLAMRLPERDGAPLRSAEANVAWLTDLSSHDPVPADRWAGDPLEAIWLPDARVARAWKEYVLAGEIFDGTPPDPPRDVRATRRGEDAIEIAWEAAADLESGLQAFVIERDGAEIGRVPERPVSKFGKPLFQAMSYHDTPEPPLPEMRYLDRGIVSGARHEYRIRSINSAGLRSEPSAPARP